MNYTKDRLEKTANHWEGQSINDKLAGREPTPMITVEMAVDRWEIIWSKDATLEMYEALKQVERWFRLHSNSPTGEFAQQVIYKALSRAESKQ